MVGKTATALLLTVNCPVCPERSATLITLPPTGVMGSVPILLEVRFRFPAPVIDPVSRTKAPRLVAGFPPATTSRLTLRRQSRWGR